MHWAYRPGARACCDNTAVQKVKHIPLSLHKVITDNAASMFMWTGPMKKNDVQSMGKKKRFGRMSQMAFLVSVLLGSTVWGRAVVCHMPQQMTPPSHWEARLDTDACTQTHNPPKKTHTHTHTPRDIQLPRGSLCKRIKYIHRHTLPLYTASCH